MRGHAYKRGATWTVVYDEQPDENGKRRQRSKGGFATKREAERFLTDTLARIGYGLLRGAVEADRRRLPRARMAPGSRRARCDR